MTKLVYLQKEKIMESREGVIEQLKTRLSENNQKLKDLPSWVETEHEKRFEYMWGVNKNNDDLKYCIRGEYIPLIYNSIG